MNFVWKLIHIFDLFFRPYKKHKEYMITILKYQVSKYLMNAEGAKYMNADLTLVPNKDNWPRLSFMFDLISSPPAKSADRINA